MPVSLSCLYSLRRHYETIKDRYDVMGVFLQGSQNYGTALNQVDYVSDVDSKAIIIPKVIDVLLCNKPVSETVNYNLELIDVKDIRLMFQNFLKQNINYLEILFTDNFSVDKKYVELWQRLKFMAEDIARYDLAKGIMCSMGMAYQKRKALFGTKEPGPLVQERIKKFGYDPKHLHHICRLNNFIKSYYVYNFSFSDSLVRDNYKIVDLKVNPIPVAEAVKLADDNMIQIKEMTNIFLEKYKQDKLFQKAIESELNSMCVKVIHDKVKEGNINEY